MELMLLIGKWIARLMDYPLGWLLLLPRDLAVVIVSVGTSVILTYGRKWTTNQDLMRRCKEDAAVLARFRRQATAVKDPVSAWVVWTLISVGVLLGILGLAFDRAHLIWIGLGIPLLALLRAIVMAVFNHRRSTAAGQLTLKRITASENMINMKKMKAEGLGLLGAILPILLLASWAFERLDYYPPAVGQELEVRACFPLSCVARKTWLIADPADKVEMLSGPVQEIVVDDNIDPETGNKLADQPTNGLAIWKIRVSEPAESIKLLIASDRHQQEHLLSVGGRVYATPLNIYDPNHTILVTQVVHRQARFLESVPGGGQFWRGWFKVRDMAPPVEKNLQGFFRVIWEKLVNWLLTMLWYISRVTLLPPWVFAYLVIVLPLIPLLRRWLRVH